MLLHGVDTLYLKPYTDKWTFFCREIFLMGSQSGHSTLLKHSFRYKEIHQLMKNYSFWFFSHTSNFFIQYLRFQKVDGLSHDCIQKTKENFGPMKAKYPCALIPRTWVSVKNRKHATMSDVEEGWNYQSFQQCLNFWWYSESNLLFSPCRTRFAWVLSGMLGLPLCV